MSPKELITTEEMAQRLNIHPKTLLRKRPQFKAGQHYFSLDPRQDRPTYRWDAEATMQYLQETSRKARRA